MAFFDLYYDNNGRLSLDNFVVGNSLSVPKKYWQKIVSNYDKDNIKWAVIRTARKFDLPIPTSHVEVGIYKAKKSFSSLINLDTRKMVRRALHGLRTKREYKWKVSDYYIRSGNLGNVSSDYFQRHNRMMAGSHKFKSPHDSWYNDDLLFYCLNALWSLKVKLINDRILYNCLALRQYAASQFRCSAAKTIYELFNAKNVLDTSSGWGDRFCGFSAAACTKFYMGIDPNLRLGKGYFNQSKFYKSFKNKKSIFVGLPAEDFDITKGIGKFDLVFTSPPYFGTEKYSEEDTQSWKRYTTKEAWLRDFLFPVLYMSWEALKIGGYLAMNIADLGVTFKEDYDVCDPMNDFIDSFQDSNYCGAIGLGLILRPHTLVGSKHKNLVEPIWVWKKGMPESIDNIVNNFKRNLA